MEKPIEKIWLKSYQPGVPAEIDPDSYANLSELLLASCEEFADKTAFSNFGVALSYHDLRNHSAHFAAYLQQVLGLTQGERLAIMLPNVLAYPVALLGALRTGLIVVNVNPLYTERELTHQLNDSGATAIVVFQNFTAVLAQALPHTAIKHSIVVTLSDLWPFVKACLANFIIKYVKKQPPTAVIAQAVAFKSALAQGQQQHLQPVQLTGEATAFLQYTGGTTGVSKGAILSHRNMVANVLQASTWVAPVMQAGKEVIVTALPLYHIFALTANCLTFLKLGGTNVLITDPRDIPAFIKTLAKTKFTALTGVSTLFNALLNHPKFSQLNFSSLKLTLSGGMAIAPTIAQRWQQVTGKPLLEAYGLTEAAPAVAINPLSLTAFNGSVGLPVAATEVKICDEQGKPVALGELGELWVKGPQIMQGYWRNPEETALVLDEAGWLRTGDIAKMNQDGYIFIVDRKKDLIIVSGFNVYPHEVEHVIAMMPQVAEVAVIGVPHPISGEIVKAYIVKKDLQLTVEQVLAHCRQQLTGYKVPKLIEFMESLPKSPVGKVLYRLLRDKN